MCFEKVRNTDLEMNSYSQDITVSYLQEDLVNFHSSGKQYYWVCDVRITTGTYIIKILLFESARGLEEKCRTHNH